MSPTGKLPTDTASLLESVVAWLDDADRAFTLLARQKGLHWNAASEVQDDVRRLAAWFDAHPHHDIDAFHAVTHGWDKCQLPPDPTTVIQQLRALANNK